MRGGVGVRVGVAAAGEGVGVLGPLPLVVHTLAGVLIQLDPCPGLRVRVGVVLV